MILTLLLSLMAAMEVSDMVRLVNGAFQYLSVYNIELHKMYDQVFNLSFEILALEGAFEKLPQNGVPLWN